MRTEVSQGRELVITEEQNLVYREPGSGAAGGSGGVVPPGVSRASARSAEINAPPDGDRVRTVEVDAVLLFRFSALTYNAHRIHYDREYARGEGYPGLVVHGPLQALLMAELARPPGRCEYSYRLVAPLFEDQGLVVSATPEGETTSVSCRDAGGRVTATGVVGPVPG